jgi:carbonic anhydrase/acetyltransferase-like protein (isoleucine patch superfamily)
MLFWAGSYCLLVFIFGLPLLATGLFVHLARGSAWIWPLLLFAPLVYTVAFVLTAGVSSLPFQSGIIAGKFPRDLRHPVYRKRRLYGLCWTSVYYFKPLYFLCLSIPSLKWLLFRLFGYRGSMKFTVYPDTWIRDLPLLRFEENVYLSNRATLATNMALSSGQILVEGITCHRDSMVGHLSMIAPGVELGAGAEVAVGCAIGIRCTIGSGALIQPICGLNHKSIIGDHAVVGSMSHIGVRARIGPHLKVAPGSLVGAKSRILTQEDADALFSSETPWDGLCSRQRALRNCK